MKILVTGSTGFIGSRLVERLMERGDSVTAAVRHTSYLDLPTQWSTVYFDLYDSSSMQAMIEEVEPDTIVHLAAQSPQAYSWQRPVDSLETTFMGTVRLLEAVKSKKSPTRFIYASSSEVYASATGNRVLNEKMAMSPISPYALAKAMGERYALMVGENSPYIDVVVMRPFNSYGRAYTGQRQFVVEKAITQALTQEAIYLNTGTPVRDFLFREDHVDGYLAVIDAASHLVRGEIFNLCTGDARTIKDVAIIIGEIVGGIRPHFLDVKDRVDDIDVLIGSHTKIKRVLGWTPKYTLEQGLRMAVDEWSAVLDVEPAGNTVVV